MKPYMNKVYRGGPAAGRCVCPYFLSESPNKLSNYILLVIISYKMFIKSENNLFET